MDTNSNKKRGAPYIRCGAADSGATGSEEGMAAKRGKTGMTAEEKKEEEANRKKPRGRKKQEEEAKRKEEEEANEKKKQEETKKPAVHPRCRDLGVSWICDNCLQQYKSKLYWWERIVASDGRKHYWCKQCVAIDQTKDVPTQQTQAIESAVVQTPKL